MADASKIAETFIYARLSGDSALLALAAGGVHAHPAPPGTTFPHVTFSPVSEIDVQTLQNNRVMTRHRYRVRCIAQGRSKPYEAVDRIDVLLHKATGTAAGGTVLSCARDSGFSLNDADQGVEYRHEGAEYVLLTSP